ncbi:MAG TPA: TIGR03619 family F420-dependent LLM class oxidoreductase [Acidimicrobiales bacterium]
MKVGLSVYNISGADLVDLAVAADELGFESLWLGEHIVLPLDYGSEHPTTGATAHRHHTGPIVDPSTILVDPLVALSAAAAATRRIKLATGIYLLPLRPPLITARMTATLHDVSRGRFLLGVGSGWLEEEFDAIGVPFAERGSRYEEAIEILRLAWSGEPFRFEGRHYRNGLVQVSESPVAVPLILGGNTERALRRAALEADGWFASGTPAFEDAVRWRDRLVQLRNDNGRGGEFPVWVRVPKPDPDDIARYGQAGLDRVLVWADQVWPATGDLAAKRAGLADAAALLGI